MALTPEQQEELAKTVAAGWAKQEELSKAQRLREGGVELDLVRAPNDPAVGEPEFQTELSIFAQSLRNTGVKYSQHFITFDAVDAHGYALAEFALNLRDAIPAALTAAGAVAGVWLNAKYGRKVRLKIGDIEAEARSPDEIQTLLSQAAEFQSKVPPKSANT